MNRNASGTEPHLKVVSRPSLYTTDTTQNASDKNVSILASLEPERPTRKVSRGLTSLILIMLLLVTLSYWAYANSIFNKPLLIPAWMETALNISKRSRPVVLPINQPTVVQLKRPPEVLVEESHAATIVNETTLPLGAEMGYQKPEITEKLAKLDVETSKKKNSDEKLVTTAVTVDQKINNQKPGSGEVVSNTKAAVPKNDSKIVETTHPTKQAKTEIAKNGKDEDVDLIAALLTRVSRPDALSKEVKHKAANAAAKSSANQSGTKRQSQVDPNRDIVARTSDDTTDGLLKRCKVLGFIEGQLCRMRICSNIWGIDPACPAPEQTPIQNLN